jgi:hypothetical protein
MPGAPSHLIWLLVLVGQTAPLDLKQAEDRMRRRPGDAVRIARELAADLPADSPASRALFRKAADITVELVAKMSREQVVDLANLYAGPLGDAATAKRVREDWLTAEARRAGQELVPGPARAQQRVELAQLWLSWLGNSKEAADLCLAALADQPDNSEAVRILRDELHYRIEGTKWVGLQPEKAARKEMEIKPGMTPAEVRKILGSPIRISRQILYRRFLEQWTYDRPEPVMVEIDYPRGLEPRVLTVHRAAGKP